MNTRSYFVILCLSAIFLSQCSQKPVDYSEAANINISWELITNLAEDKNLFEAKFTIENHAGFQLDENWKLFFNIAPRPIVDMPTPQPAVIRHINGDWFEMVPEEGFSLDPHETIEVHYRGTEGVIKESDGPLGCYFVFYDEQGGEQAIVPVACTIMPFDRPEQLTRDHNDEEPIPTAAYRFRENNYHVRELSPEQLPIVIPTPVSVKLKGGLVDVDEKWSISHEPALENEARYLAEKLKAIGGVEFQLTTDNPSGQAIFLKTGNVSVSGISDEAYSVEVENSKIFITGNEAAGVFYGVQSLMALVPIEAYKNHSTTISIPTVSIKDAPRFRFRGLHTDLGRNFQNKETILRILDIMSFYKLNRYLFYMTEDEGWRLEIPGLPELTEIGGQRKHTASYHDAVLHPAYGSGPFAYGEGSNGSGYISRNDFLEILKFAKARHIQVIPEVNFPGHARCAIKPMEARYGRLIAEGKESEANEYRLIDPEDKSVYLSAQGYKDNIVSVANEGTYRFYKKVMDEIALMYREVGLELKEIHAGGDEVPEGSWSASPMAAEIMKANPQYKDPKNLQAYFFKRLLETLKDDNYVIHGWEEVALLKNDDGTYSPNPEFAGKNVIPYVWNTLSGNQDLAYRIANAGYDVVLCPVSNFYFDLAYNKDPKEPGLYWAGFVDTYDAWAFAPFDMFITTTHESNGRRINTDEEYADMERLRPEARKRILGVEAQLWSETIKGRDMIENYMLPKLIGFTESAWAAERNWESMEDVEAREREMETQWNVFANALAQKELPRLSYLNGGYNYRVPLPGAVVTNGQLQANIEYPGLQLRFTTDGSEPSMNSTLYTGVVDVVGEVKIAAFDASGKPSRTVLVK